MHFLRCRKRTSKATLLLVIKEEASVKKNKKHFLKLSIFKLPFMVMALTILSKKLFGLQCVESPKLPMSYSSEIIDSI